MHGMCEVLNLNLHEEPLLSDLAFWLDIDRPNKANGERSWGSCLHDWQEHAVQSSAKCEVVEH